MENISPGPSCHIIKTDDADHDSESSVNSVNDLFTAAKKSPRKLFYGASGNGGGPPSSDGDIQEGTSIDIKHVPYRGSAPALTELLDGQTDTMVDTISLVRPYVTSGKMRALAQTGVKRSSYRPNIPTMREVEASGYEASSWLALAAPAGTSAAVVQKLNVAVNDVLKTPTVR
ncbi:tripartite tricarboxylate transporter substrate-binding protein [Cupriavidus basilensis]|uniref:Tripartite tricarboxylate transporter substrate-binding protein n=1 Tax=Cupriavidus basilensis TaxID=68895 RepID=A0ABT6ARD2_9BURK|nr:tripartite tricarboxylate transporter substrate-binding protein [Cupriavidus basilensis]MDF3835190.1 tripartite tricarboxylate transporter substrate-binding protein [Cupriavidus basilensis]